MTRNRKLAALVGLAEMQKDVGLAALAAAQRSCDEISLRLAAMDSAAEMARQTLAEAPDPATLAAQDGFAELVRHHRHDLLQDLAQRTEASANARQDAARAFGRYKALCALSGKTSRTSGRQA